MNDRKIKKGDTFTIPKLSIMDKLTSPFKENLPYVCVKVLEFKGLPSEIYVDDENWVSEDICVLVKLELNDKNANRLNEFAFLFSDLLSPMSRFTTDVNEIYAAIKSVMTQSENTRQDLHASLCTNRQEQNSLQENLQLAVLEYIYDKEQ